MRAATFWLIVGALALSPLAATSSGAAGSRPPTAPHSDPTQRSAPDGGDVPPSGQSQAGAPGDRAGEVGAFLIDRESEPLAIRGPVSGGDGTLHLREVAGREVTVRATPVDDAGNPIDGGRVIVLRPNETRSVRLADTLPIEDLLGHRLAVETIRGAGQAQVEASWLTPEEAAAAPPHVPRRHLTGEEPPTSDELIDRAEANGTLDHETAVLYHVYAIFGDARLPAAYRGDDGAEFESLYLSTAAAEWPTYSTATQTALQPFLIPPAYQGSWISPAGGVTALDLAPICTSFSVRWNYAETPNGPVRIWFDTSAGDSDRAALLALAAEQKIWPVFTGIMGTHAPLPDGSVLCNGGNNRLDVYLTDIARSFTQGHSGCSNSPAYIVLDRSASVDTLAHEIFHAFQFSFQIGSCLVDQNYRWWTEGSATWAQLQVYPFSTEALAQMSRLFVKPKASFEQEAGDKDRGYGTFVLPWYVAKHYDSTDFVRVAWEKCRSEDAIHAVNDSIPGGFDQVWPEVALRDWNYRGADDYTRWAPYTSQFHAKPDRWRDVGSNWEPDHEEGVAASLSHLTATYSYFHFTGAAISSVAFFNGATFDLEKQAAPPFGPLWNPQPATPDKVKGIKVQAIVIIEGQDPRVEDWTDKPYVTFCRDTTDERLESLTIITSNSRLDDTGGSATPPGMNPLLWASNMGCWQWSGTAHYNLTGQVAGSQVDDANDVVWTRVSGTHAPPEILYQATGHVSVTLGNQCSGGGTFTITPSATSLATYNYTPADAAGRRGYLGSAFEFTGIPNAVCSGKPALAYVGQWFNIVPPAPPNPPVFKFSADGKTMNGSYTDTTGGLNWTWNFTAQRQ